MQNQNVFKLKEISQKAPTRKKLYHLIQKIYDLPNFGPVISQEYLAELIKPDCKYLKVLRSETHTIPKGQKRNWNSVQAFNLLVKTLEEQGKKACGFTMFNIPNIKWMLRIIIWANPLLKDEIISQTTQNHKGLTKKQKEINNKLVIIDPKLQELFKNEIPQKKVTNQNYRLFTDSLQESDLFMQESIQRMIDQKQLKAIKLKMQIEQALQDQEDLMKLKLIRKQEAQLKKQKQQMRSNKKIKREEAMQKLLDGDPLQTPLTNKFFSLNLENNNNFENRQAQFDRAMMESVKEQKNEEEFKEYQGQLFTAHNPSNIFSESSIVLEKSKSKEQFNMSNPLYQPNQSGIQEKQMPKRRSARRKQMKLKDKQIKQGKVSKTAMETEELL